MILQKWENNGTEEIGLVTPTPVRDNTKQWPLTPYNHYHVVDLVIRKYSGVNIDRIHKLSSHSIISCKPYIIKAIIDVVPG